MGIDYGVAWNGDISPLQWVGMRTAGPPSAASCSDTGHREWMKKRAWLHRWGLQGKWVGLSRGPCRGSGRSSTANRLTPEAISSRWSLHFSKLLSNFLVVPTILQSTHRVGLVDAMQWMHWHINKYNIHCNLITCKTANHWKNLRKLLGYTPV